ncbi:MAG: helix-turn-helix transcriptional regulator [Myxococcota bacterium]
MPDSPLRKGIERRLRFIEFRLQWEGRINRGDLVETFGISIPQASSDIAQYDDLAPDNLSYDASAKTYFAADSLVPIFEPADPQDYLSRLRSISYGLSTPSEMWIGRAPVVGRVPYPKRGVTAATLRHVLRAMSEQLALEIHYQSLTRAEPIWRWITPHAFGYDGHRWHARAFCHKRGDFRDFVLGRILEIRAEKPDQIDPRDDRAWQTEVTLLVGVHRDLSEAQRRSVELDYEMTDGRLEIPVRAALVHYIKRWLRLDLDPDKVRPEQQQVVLVNRNEIDEVVSQLRGY